MSFFPQLWAMTLDLRSKHRLWTDRNVVVGKVSLRANKRQTESTSKRIHAFVLCSSVFAKLTLSRDKAILITGMSFWTSSLLIFYFEMGAKSESFHVSFPQQFLSSINFTRGIFLNTSCFIIWSLFLAATPSCFPVKWSTPEWRKKGDVVNHSSGLHKYLTIPNCGR